eukprot:366336-Chlamydomonas_euryale.AAC.9
MTSHDSMSSGKTQRMCVYLNGNSVAFHAVTASCDLIRIRNSGTLRTIIPWHAPASTPDQTATAVRPAGDSRWPFWRIAAQVLDEGGQNMGHTLDNSWAVPYNQSLLLRYVCNINIEVCVTLKSKDLKNRALFFDALHSPPNLQTPSQYIAHSRSRVALGVRSTRADIRRDAAASPPTPPGPWPVSKNRLQIAQKSKNRRRKNGDYRKRVYEASFARASRLWTGRGAACASLATLLIPTLPPPPPPPRVPKHRHQSEWTGMILLYLLWHAYYHLRLSVRVPDRKRCLADRRRRRRWRRSASRLATRTSAPQRATSSTQSLFASSGGMLTAW